MSKLSEVQLLAFIISLIAPLLVYQGERGTAEALTCCIKHIRILSKRSGERLILRTVKQLF